MSAKRASNLTPEEIEPKSLARGFDAQGSALSPSAITENELPKGWRWVRVNEIGEVKLGRQRAPKHQNGANMRPYLRVANVFEDRLDLSDVLTMNFTPSEFETFALRENDILLNEGQSLHLVGRSALYRGEVPGACFQNTLVRFRAGPSVEPKFALTIFRGYMHTGKFQKIARWTTNIAHLGAQRFAEMPFPLPPLPDQRRIVAEIEKQFTRLDAGIAALRRTQANLKRYRAAVLKAACEGRLVPTEAELAKKHSSKRGSIPQKNGTPDFESGAMLLERILRERCLTWQGRGQYKEPARPDTNNLSLLPDGWTWATLEQLCPLFADSAHRTPQYGEEGLPALGPRDVVGGKLNLKRARLVNDSEFAIQTARHVPQAGDIVYSRELSLGWGAVVPAGQRLCLSQGMCVFRPHPDVNLNYFLALLNGPVGRKHAENAATGSAHPHINLGDIKTYVFPLPPLAEQRRIVAEVERRLSVVEELETVVNANLQRATRLRQAILLRAFSVRAA